MDGTKDRSPLRYSLAMLITAVLVLSVYFAALRSATQEWASAALTLTVGGLAGGLLWGLFRPGADRAFWTGFELFGWGYLLLAMTPWFGGTLSPQLATTRLAGWLHARMPLASQQDVQVEWHGTWWAASVLERDGRRFRIKYNGFGPEWDEWVGANRVRLDNENHFLQVSHALAGLAWAIVGGILGTAAAGQRRPWVGWLLAGLAGVSACLALGAIVWGSPALAAVALNAALPAMFLAVLGALYLCGRPRVVCYSVALAAWAYWLLHFGPGQPLGLRLLTSTAVAQLQNWLEPPVVHVNGIAGYWASNSMTYLQQSGHCLLMWLIALGSGLLAARLRGYVGPTAPASTGATNE
jgi:hypothetical protein